MLKEIEPRQNAVCIRFGEGEGIGGNWSVWIECKDIDLLPELQKKAREIIKLIKGESNA